MHMSMHDFDARASGLRHGGSGESRFHFEGSFAGAALTGSRVLGAGPDRPTVRTGFAALGMGGASDAIGIASSIEVVGTGVGATEGATAAVALGVGRVTSDGVDREKAIQTPRPVTIAAIPSSQGHTRARCTG